MIAASMAALRARTGWIVTLWFVAAAFEASQSIFVLHKEGKTGGEVLLFVTEFAAWLPWVLATPVIIGLARRFPVIRAPSFRGVAIHFAMFGAVSLAAEAWSAVLQVLFNPWANSRAPTFWSTWNTTLVFQAMNCLAAYALILTITFLADSREQAARQETEAARLNEELSKAQLATLRRQIEPHFMFNALNSIAGLVRDRRNDAAVNMIVGLSEFLRRASADSNRPQVPLAEEVEYLQRYIEIQQVRFGDRLRFEVDIPADLMNAQVPGLLLQPLVENAVKHGVANRISGGAIRVGATRDEGRLRLSVYNDGGLAEAGEDADGAGVGLLNLRTRLGILHGENADLRLYPVGSEGVEVVVTLPLVDP